MNQAISAIEISGVKAMEGSDRALFARILEHLLGSSARRDADTDDADWVNAFGGAKRGRTEIAESPWRFDASSLHPQGQSALESRTRTQMDSKEATAGRRTDRVGSLIHGAHAQLAPAFGTAVLIVGIVAVVLAPGFARDEVSARLRIEAPVPAATAIAVAQDR